MSEALFSDRFWLIKAALAMALFGVLGRWAQRDLVEADPDFELCAVYPDRLAGREVTFFAERVIDVSDRGFRVDTDYGPVEILSDAPPPAPGSRVTGEGIVVGRRRIRSDVWYPNPGYGWKRVATYGISVAVLLPFLWLMGRRFRSGLSAGVFRSRY